MSIMINMNYAVIKINQLIYYCTIYGFIGPFRFFRYNILTKLMRKGKNFKIILPSGHPCQIRCGTTDLSTFHQIWISSEYNLKNIRGWEKIHGDYRKIIEEGHVPLIVDCGANVGFSVSYFRHMFPEARIIGIEPERENFKAMLANIGGMENVTLRRAAVWDRVEKLRIKPDASGFSSAFQTVQATGPEDGEFVETVTVDAVVAGMGARHRPFLVKMDIEGAERRALYGAVETQKSGAILIIEPHDWLEGISGSLDGIEALVTHWSFNFFARGENVIFVPVRPKSIQKSFVSRTPGCSGAGL
jgi:FkbM family methyltransferase